MPSILAQLLSPAPVVSVEFFPPKTPESETAFLRSAELLRGEAPDFASITYGAGGSTRERTLRFARTLATDLGYTVMPHLTCVGHSRAELEGILDQFTEAGFPAVMALRGDPPRGASSFEPHPEGFAHAKGLVALIRERNPAFEIGVAGYPGTHPEAPDAATDILHLCAKVEAGGDFITTQLFLDNRYYHRFVDALRRAGCAAPVLPGLLIPGSREQLQRFTAFCGSEIPPELDAAMAQAPDLENQARTGLDWVFEQACDLLEAGAPGIHLYILNRAEPARELLRRLRDAGRL